MNCKSIVVALLVVFAVYVSAEDDKKALKKLQIGIKKRVENCVTKSRKGDSLQMYVTCFEFIRNIYFKYFCFKKALHRKT